MRKGITRNKGNKSILPNATLGIVTLLVCTVFILTSISSISFAEEILFSKFAFEAMNSWTKVPNKGHLKITTEIVRTASGYDITFSLEEDSKTHAIQVKSITGYIFDEQKMVDTFSINDSPKIEAGSQEKITPVYLNASAHYWVGLEVETNDGQVFKYIRQLPENKDTTSTGIAFSGSNDDDSGEANDGSSYQEQFSNDEEVAAVADDTETEDTEIDDTVSYDAETVNTQADDTETQDNTESIDAEPNEE